MVMQPRVRSIRDLLGEPRGQARLADARFARDQHNLAVPRPGAALPRDQVGALGLASDNAGQPRWMSCLEPALAFGHAKRRPCFDGLGKALDGVLAEVAQPETIAEQPPRRCGHHDPTGLGEALQSCGQIGGVADDGLLLRRALAHEIAGDDESGRDSNAHGELFARACLQAGDDLGDFERRMDRARGVVLMRAGKAEIGQNAVAHELGDEAVVARDRARTASW